MHTRTRFVALLSGMAMLLTGTLALPASAADALEVSVTGPVTLTNHILATVPVKITCSPPQTTPLYDYVSVQLQQASGQRVNLATGYVLSASLLTCDGTTVNTIMVPVTPPPFTNNGPFHGGPAIAQAEVDIEGGISCGIGCTINAFVIEQNASAPTSILLQG